MGGADHPGGLTRAVARALAGLAQGERVVVAVSGGADSVALGHLVAAARPDLALTVGHVRHGLRDDAPDAAAARALAEVLGVSWVQRAVVVGGGAGPEDAARRARHAALSEIAATAGASALLLGHTADDQAETVLLRIARGTGPDGLAGMAPEFRRPDGLRVLRPLLGLRRHDVRSVPPTGTWVEDPTNADPDQRRARARHEALPALGRLRPDEGDVVPALVRLADLARGDRELLELLAARAVVQRYGPALLVPRDGGVVPGLRGVQARLLRRAWRLLPGAPHPPSARMLDTVLALPLGARATAPGGVLVTASASGWVLDPEAGSTPAPLALALGGRVHLPGLGVELACTRHELEPSSAVTPNDADPSTVVAIDPAPWSLHLPLVPGPLAVTSRQDPGGRDVREELRRAVPAGMRHLVPVLRDADGRALAVGSRALVHPLPSGPALVVTATPAGRA